MGEIISTILLVLVLIAAASLLGGLIIMLLWNWIIVSLFGAVLITFWQGVGVSFILSIIGGLFSRS